jgi:FADH2 O2-dependent halogenase
MGAPLYDIAIVGSGFAGSLLSMICHRLGRSVILLEKGKHPRFTIGESSTPLTNLLLEELSIRYNLPALTPLAKWGTWQQSYPNMACGLKRGFSFYHHMLGCEDRADPNRDNQLLVAASPNDRIADTHWYRPEFDQFFANQAQRLGVEYLDEIDLTVVSELDDAIELSGCKNRQDVKIRAGFLVDATGPRGFLHQALQLPELALPGYPVTEALYSHFEGVGRYADSLGNANHLPPYPIDNAAVHHIFDGGWIWVLQFNNGITSAGVAATSEAAVRLKLCQGEKVWPELLSLIPGLKKQFAKARNIRPFTYVPQLSFRSGRVAGDRWMMLPSAAGFVDPLLSTGFALTLLGISRLSELIERAWNSDDFFCKVVKVADRSEGELLATARLIGSLYASMNNFPVFVSMSLLYFAAVIFSESARRLGKPQMAASFLLHDHPYFGPQCREIYKRLERGDAGDSTLCDDIIRAIEPINLAGLGDARRRNWYPVDAADLFAGAWKVDATAEEITGLLHRAGF